MSISDRHISELSWFLLLSIFKIHPYAADKKLSEARDRFGADLAWRLWARGIFCASFEGDVSTDIPDCDTSVRQCVRFKENYDLSVNF